jgi:DNA/RNA endonuclease G (NUC1)
MKKLLFLFLLITQPLLSQTISGNNKNLVIKHKDITLYLDTDTSTMVSKLNFKYSNFSKLGKYPRCNCWFIDTLSRLKESNYSTYIKSDFDRGHLTPSHIVTYDSLINKYSFSLFNQAPQYSYFNQHPWEKLEERTEKIIDSLKQDAVIITGVIYNEKSKTYLGKVKIPTHYYKILTIGKNQWVWIAQNSAKKEECVVKSTTLKDLNDVFVKNKMKLKIK